MNATRPPVMPPTAGPATDPPPPDGAGDGMPRRFGKYTLLRKLATGGMAELFLALQKSVAGFEKLLVIKRILPAMNQDRAFIDMLLHEARIAATLTHANIVQIFDVGQVDGTYYIAMEHVHGEDLRGIVRQMRKKGVIEFPLEHAIAVMLGVTSGLSYAHEKRDLDGSSLNIVHRDISPQNVIVTFSGDVKVVDFGIAKSDTKAGIGMETQTGKLKGKVPYMSPEQARGEVIDARSDVFAVGVMLFELTTGRRLFKGASEYETLKLICDREYPKPSSVHPGYPPELEAIVMKALTKDRNARYQSARELQSALEDYVRRERIAVSNVALTQYMQSLFEEKLLAQKEQILQGKQLADIIDLQQPDGGQGDDGQRLSSSVLSAPSAARTVTEIRVVKRTSPVMITALAALITTTLFAVAYGWHIHKKALQDAAVVLPPPPPVVPANRGSIALTSTPPGATIWIDGEMRSEVTPAQVSQLPTGRAIEVKMSMEGFEALKKTITLTDTEPSATWDSPLSKGSVTLDLSVKPKLDSMVLLLDGKPFSMSNATGVTSGDQHKLVVSAPGYVDQAFTFIASPQETKHFDVVLVKETHRVHVSNPGNTGPAPGPAPGAGGSGKLNVGASNGWCNVSVDGVARGATPVAGLELSAGSHRVVCTPPDHPAMSTSVSITSDGTTRYRFTLP